MTSLCTKSLCIWLIAGMILTGAPIPGQAKISDSSSEGAVITVGLFVTILAVLFIIGFQSDMENVFSQRSGRANLVQAPENDVLTFESMTSEPAPGLGLRLTF